jgi:hypothetical protein
MALSIMQAEKPTAMTRKARGRQSEILLAEYLQHHGFIVYPTNSGAAGSDIVGMQGVDWEVKSRRDFNPSGLLKQLERRRRDTGLGLGVMRLNGQGEASIGDWCGIVRLDDLVYLLKAAGYGQR